MSHERVCESVVRVRYEETDQMGVVYHANYLRYFEIGRTDYLRERGMTYRELEERGVLLAVVEVACRYLGSARYDDLLVVRTRLDDVGRVRLAFEYEIARQGEDASLVTGRTVLACLGRDRRPRKLPPELLAAIGPAGET